MSAPQNEAETNEPVDAVDDPWRQRMNDDGTTDVELVVSYDPGKTNVDTLASLLLDVEGVSSVVASETEDD